VLVTLLSVPAPDAGEIDQVTPACVGSYCTLAVSACVVPAGTNELLSETVTVFAGTVSMAEADADELATDVAVTVTAKSLGGGVAGGL
jgi:hypothetical protein